MAATRAALRATRAAAQPTRTRRQTIRTAEAALAQTVARVAPEVLAGRAPASSEASAAPELELRTTARIGIPSQTPAALIAARTAQASTAVEPRAAEL